jgi:Domain of unknown function (DUF4202)
MPNLQQAFQAFDAYNAQDPNKEQHAGKDVPKELLYAQRMSAWLDRYSPNAAEHVQLAARCQHIGRWEIPRKDYPMDRKGYLQWRNQLKFHHADIAEKILKECGYGQDIIESVKFLLLKKELQRNPETQLLEDVICQVFIEFYLEAFVQQHEEAKVIDILKKTLKKMTPRAISTAMEISVSARVKELIGKAAS